YGSYGGFQSDRLRSATRAAGRIAEWTPLHCHFRPGSRRGGCDYRYLEVALASILEGQGQREGPAGYERLLEVGEPNMETSRVQADGLARRNVDRFNIDHLHRRAAIGHRHQ